MAADGKTAFSGSARASAKAVSSGGDAIGGNEMSSKEVPGRCCGSFAAGVAEVDCDEVDLPLVGDLTGD